LHGCDLNEGKEGGAEFVVACSRCFFDVIDLSGRFGFAQLDAHSSTAVNDAPIKTEEIATTEFNDDIKSNVTHGRNGNDISRAHAAMSSGNSRVSRPHARRVVCDTYTILRLCVRSVASLPNLFNLAGAAEQRERNSFMRREHPLGRLSRQPGFAAMVDKS